MPLAGFSDIDPCTAVALPGAGVLEYVPLDEVDTTAWNPAVLESDYNQQAAAGVATWYRLDYLPGSGQWTEEQQQSDQGDYFRINVSASMSADTPTVRGELDRMRRRPYLLRLTRGSTVLLIGNPDQPLRFESRFDSGSAGGDNRLHRIQFTGASLRKSPGYVPVF